MYLFPWVTFLFTWCSSSFLKTALFNYLLIKSYMPMSLSSVTKRLLWLFDNVMFSWFFMILEVLCYSLYMNSNYLLKFLLNVFGIKITSVSPARDSEAFQVLLWVHRLHASLPILWQNSMLICTLWILQGTRPSSDSLSFVFSNVKLQLILMVSLKPADLILLSASALYQLPKFAFITTWGAFIGSKS